MDSNEMGRAYCQIWYYVKIKHDLYHIIQQYQFKKICVISYIYISRYENEKHNSNQFCIIDEAAPIREVLNPSSNDSHAPLVEANTSGEENVKVQTVS